jgi:hypothetical protein
LISYVPSEAIVRCTCLRPRIWTLILGQANSTASLIIGTCVRLLRAWNLREIEAEAVRLGLKMCCALLRKVIVRGIANRCRNASCALNRCTSDWLYLAQGVVCHVKAKVAGGNFGIDRDRELS